jgi:hypothetical protein
MTATTAPTLLPGLTQGQRQQVADALSRVGTVPVGLLALVYMDVDRYAAQAFSARYAVRAALRGERNAVRRADDVADIVSHEHHVTMQAASFAYGCAIGLRLGQRFWPRSTRTQRYLSDDFAKLDRNQRDRVTRIVRNLLEGIEPYRTPGPRPGTKPRHVTIATDLAAAKRLLREAGQRVRAEARR